MSLDDVARGMASDGISRRKALKGMVAALGAGVAFIAGGGTASAARRQCPPGTSHPCGPDTCCPKDTACCTSSEGLKACCPNELITLCPGIKIGRLVELGCVAV